MRKLLVCALVALTATVAGVSASYAATPSIVAYNSTVSPLPSHMPSVGAEATPFDQFGDEVTFRTPVSRLTYVTVTMDSFGCQSGHWGDSNDCVTTAGATFSIPITLNIYAPSTDGQTAGALLATQTRTFELPYRPSADHQNCAEAGSTGKWYDGHACFNGKAANITFDFTGGPSAVKLPQTVVYSVTYNTTHHGTHPVGESAPCYTSSGGCAYDSLNIAVSKAVKAGLRPYPGSVFQNAALAGVDWAPSYVPAAQFQTARLVRQ